MDKKKNCGIFNFFILIYKRLFEINDSPQRIALGFGLGVFLGIIPGTGPIASVICAYMLRLNRAAALFGSLLTNTWLSLAAILLSIKIGAFIFGLSWMDLYRQWLDFLKNFHYSKLFSFNVLNMMLPVIVGYFIIALCMGALVYLVTLAIFYSKKHITNKKAFAAAIIFIFLFLGIGFAGEDKKIYLEGVSEAKSGRLDFAYMNFRGLIKKYPESRYAKEALFSIGEYNFLITDYRGAKQYFLEFINKYPDSGSVPLAFAYLLAVAKKENNQSLVKILEKNIVTSKQLSLLFRDFREYKYRSALNKKHRVLYYIDNVEFYVDGELFAKILY